MGAAVKRREALVGMAAMATATVVREAHAATPEPVVKLRLLETSDLHSFIFDYNYVRNRPDEKVGFGRIATLVRRARAEVRNSLLFDNGDIIQGNALADYMVAQGLAKGAAEHPMFKAMNYLKYDAATIGNHEFDFGVEFMRAALSKAEFPFVCANAVLADGSLMFPPYTIIEREVEDEKGGKQQIRLGVIGFVTPEFVTFDKSQVFGTVSAYDIVETARKYIPELRAKVDVVVVLSHSGISDAPHVDKEENASLHLAEVPGIDVLFTGHEHRVFPGPFFTSVDGLDNNRGTLHGVPAVMPGFWGSHLGVIDLVLRKNPTGWKVEDFVVQARPIYHADGNDISPLVPLDPGLLATATDIHKATIDWFNRPFATLSRSVTSYFSYVGSSGAVELVTAALHRYASDTLGDKRPSGAPLLAASAPLKMGWQGPDAFTDIPAGPVALRDITDRWMDPNRLCVVRVNGAIVREWLERSACIFNLIDPGKVGPQELIDQHIPSYAFDMVAGLKYSINPTKAKRYAVDGTLVRRDIRRVSDIILDGVPLQDDQIIFVATNSWRADGGHSFPGLDGSNIVLRSSITIKEIIKEYLSGPNAKTAAPPIDWRLICNDRRPVDVTFLSGPGVLRYLPASSDVKRLATLQNGYLQLVTHLT